MFVGVIIIAVFAIAGIFTGMNLSLPYTYSEYFAVAILACLDSVFGALVANKKNNFKINIFLSGFFGNAIISIFLVYLGAKLDVDIYLAAVIVFTSRIINNFASLRREIVSEINEKIENKYIKKENKKISKNI